MASLNEIQTSVARQIQMSEPLKQLTASQLLDFAVTGLNEEAGEVSGLCCREIYKKKDISTEWWTEELGDVLWYLVAAAWAKGLSLEDIWKYNEAKLIERYGEFRERG